MERLILLLCLIAFVSVAFGQCGDSDWWCNPWLDASFPPGSLLLYYNMDSLTATCDINDFSGNDNHSAIYYATPTSGYDKGCSHDTLGYYFDGGDWMVTPNPSSTFGSGEFAFAMWVYRDVGSPSAMFALISFEKTVASYWSIFLYSNKIECRIGSDARGLSDSTLAEGVWTHVVVQRAADDIIRCYYDTLFVGSRYDSDDGSNSNDLYIGRLEWYGAAFWEGKIDELWILEDDIFSQAEIANLYKYGNPSGVCTAAPAGGAKWRGVVIDGKLQTWRTQ